MDTKETIISLLTETKREGIDGLILEMQDKGFFESPASTKFHGCYPGGLAQHSLNVYLLLIEQTKPLALDTPSGPGQKPLTIKPENLIIAALLHDVCKIGAYIPDGESYKWNKQQPPGHAQLSLRRIEAFIKLAPIEEMMIRFHMGVYGLNEYEEPGEYALRGDETLKKEDRYGKSLANAWYHNPIVKVMYFCDELATLREKK
jgi:hypothetical protein